MKARRKYIPKRDKVSRVDREESRKFASTVSTGLLVVGVIVALVAMANKWMKKEELERIRLVGRVILDSTEIVERAAIPDSATLRKLDLKAIEERLRSHPFISEASVYRGENGTLVMEIRERAPVAVTFIGSTPVYLDSIGMTLPYRFSSAAFDVPIVDGVVADGAVDSLEALEAVGVVRGVREFDETLYREISEIRREPDGEYVLVTTDGAIPVRVGMADEVVSRLGKLDLFWRTVLASEGTNGIRYIDLRWDGQVVVKRDGGRT